MEYNSNNCSGTHRFFIADVAQVEAEGKVILIAMCTNCGVTKVSEHQVAKKGK